MLFIVKWLLLSSVIFLLAGGGIYMYFPDVYMRVESSLLSLLDQYGNPSSGEGQSSSTMITATESTEGKPEETSEENVFAGLPKCVGGNISEFTEKVKAESRQITEMDSKITNIYPPTAITQPCSVSLEEIDRRIKSIQEIIPNLTSLQKQSKNTEKCFEETQGWLNDASSKFSRPPLDANLANIKNSLTDTKEKWQSEANKLVAEQKTRLEENYKDYKMLSDLYKVYCSSSPPKPAEPSKLEPPMPAQIPKECQDPSYRIDHPVECIK